MNALLVGVLTALMAMSPLAGDPPRGIGGSLVDDEARLRGLAQGAPTGRGVGEASGVATGPAYEFTYRPACLGNDANSEGADAGCPQADALCPDVAVMYWLYRREVGAGAPWQQAGARCLAPAEAAALAPVLPGFTLADFRRLPLPAGTANVEPGNGITLVNMPTNVYAQAGPVTLDTDLLGFPVQVRATPSQFRWDFGDGAGYGPTEEAGAPYPALTITHEYTGAGSYPITLTTYYTGEYSIAGGPFLPIDGEAEVASAPVPVEALVGRNHLVGGDTG